MARQWIHTGSRRKLDYNLAAHQKEVRRKAAVAKKKKDARFLAILAKVILPAPITLTLTLNTNPKESSSGLPSPAGSPGMGPMAATMPLPSAHERYAKRNANRVLSEQEVS